MAVLAVREALADAGSVAGRRLRLRRIQGRRQRRTPWWSDLGLTGIPFVNVRNGCATGGSALASAGNAIRAAATAELGVVVGFDKHPRGRLRPATRAATAWATGTARPG